MPQEVYAKWRPSGPSGPLLRLSVYPECKRLTFSTSWRIYTS